MEYCEHCNAEIEEPAYVQKVQGYEGTIELWFCEDCSNDR